VRRVMATHGEGLRADAARNYERIVVAAGQAFEDVGPDATLEEIARKAEVGVATLYRRFRNREQLVGAVFGHLLATEIEPSTTVHSDDPWEDLVSALEATIDVLARRRVILALAREMHAFDVESIRRYVRSMERLLWRAIEGKLVRPELEVRDLSAVIVMALATVHSNDPDGLDRRRYLALLLDGLRPSPTTLPPPLTRRIPGT
jgi:AcrR family transcriptional regulator